VIDLAGRDGDRLADVREVERSAGRGLADEEILEARLNRGAYGAGVGGELDFGVELHLDGSRDENGRGHRAPVVDIRLHLGHLSRVGDRPVLVLVHRERDADRPRAEGLGDRPRARHAGNLFRPGDVIGLASPLRPRA